MSAGTGVRHSEYNHEKSGVTHFLQIWIEPKFSGIKPSYEQKHFSAADKRGRLRLIASADGAEGSVTIHQDARVYAGLFDGAERARVELAAGRLAYVHLARGEASVNGQALSAGDALKTDEVAIEIRDGRGAEVLLFDLPRGSAPAIAYIGTTQWPAARRLARLNLPLSNRTSTMAINTGIGAKDRAAIAQGLSRVLADTYLLYLKTHNFHWNVEGPMFQTLHMMFMEQYTEAWNAIDLVAERIRALGHYAPGTYKEYLKLGSIKETEGVPKAEQMVKLLIEAQEAVVRTARGVLPLAERANDQPTLDVLTQRMDVHEKNAWMLRSLLKK
jgi:starvation-inducible DNA-binding protein